MSAFAVLLSKNLALGRDSAELSFRHAANAPPARRDESLVETTEALLSLSKFAARLQLEAEDILKHEPRKLTPQFAERYIDLQSRYKSLNSRKTRDKLDPLQAQVLPVLEKAVMSGKYLQECSRHLHNARLLGAADANFVGTYRLAELSDSFMRDFQTDAGKELRDAIGPLLTTKILASPIQKGWVPTQMNRISRQRFEGGFKLLARLAFDVDATGYVFGFSVDPENEAKIFDIQGGLPPKDWGFRKDDIVTAVDGTAVKSIEEMKVALLANPTKESQVTVDRKGKSVTLKVNITSLTK